MANEGILAQLQQLMQSSPELVQQFISTMMNRGGGSNGGGQMQQPNAWASHYNAPNAPVMPQAGDYSNDTISDAEAAAMVKAEHGGSDAVPMPPSPPQMNSWAQHYGADQQQGRPSPTVEGTVKDVEMAGEEQAPEHKRPAETQDIDVMQMTRQAQASPRPQPEQSADTSVPMPPERPSGRDVYTVRQGDTLWDIAKKVYGDPRMYKHLAAANNIKNPDQIAIGQKLQLAEVPTPPQL